MLKKSVEKEVFFKFLITTHHDLVNNNSLELQDLFSPIRRNLYMILISGEKPLKHYVDDKVVNLDPNTCLFVGPDRLSHFDKETCDEARVIFFSNLFYSRVPRDAHFLESCDLFHNYGSIYINTLKGENINYVKTMVDYLYIAQKNKNKDIYSNLAHNVIQQSLILGTIQSQKTSYLNFMEDKDNILVLNFRNLLNEHFRTEKSVQFYAEQLNVTEKRLSKATKQIFDLSAKEVITKKVMKEAKWQLIYSQDSIKEIAVNLGFLEEHNFSSFFLKNEGMRPKQFRTTYKHF